MRLAYCIVMIILLCTYIAVEEREIRIAKEEAYQDGYRKGLKECHKLPTRPIILDDSTEDIWHMAMMDKKCITALRGCRCRNRIRRKQNDK